MSTKKKWYEYCGPVIENDICIARNWSVQTFATSPKKALSNLSFRFKRDNNRAANTKIQLDIRYLKEHGVDE